MRWIQKTRVFFRNVAARHITTPSVPARPVADIDIPPQETGWSLHFWKPEEDNRSGIWQQFTQIKRDPKEVQRILDFTKRQNPGEHVHVIRVETHYSIDTSFDVTDPPLTTNSAPPENST